MKILPRDLQPGMFAKFYVNDVGYGQEFMQFCEVVSVKKLRVDSETKYRIRITEPITPNRSRVRHSTRIFSPKDRLEVKETETLGDVTMTKRDDGTWECSQGCPFVFQRDESQDDVAYHLEWHRQQAEAQS